MKKWLLASCLLLLGTFTIMAQQYNFDIQGHRGARGLVPENTIPAFYRAIDEGVHTLELDVVISKDKKVVVSHDNYFNPAITTDPNGQPISEKTKGNLYELTYKEIKLYDVGLRGHPDYPEQEKMAIYKPLLKDVIKAAEKYAKKKGVPPLNYNIELKSVVEDYRIAQPEAPEFSDLVYDVIFKQLNAERVTIQSFDFNILKYWYSRINAGEYDNVALSALIEPYNDNDIDLNLNLLGFKPTIWSPYFHHINKSKVKKLHQMGIKVIPWTVNELKDMISVKEMGCDGLITDYPNRAKSL
ncbi:glycerophosphodiester phosphodiesterase family protein [Arcticibacterium luteifluviistationis]|uniref:Glycerophosphodiester phosphodiesterase n=1 Tax=Arcticibacterium luteifluviistationis TaxID=1784714 RepID=A0A2Z4GCB1_9BACT|nr:glycerophosphodiester phosphodiesterase family protein [Arcticibacterium luteifluviistationis]AWV98932.1 glycerophosphodiester phosphodiesterase [Arcticibacterium luteifluviistationis]